jgi:hypothetical protein
MRTLEFHIDYFDQTHFDTPFDDNKDPRFQLGIGDVGDTKIIEYKVFSSPPDFPGVALAILDYLKDSDYRRETPSFETVYILTFSESASAQLDGTGKRVLEEIVSLHNDLVAPRMRLMSGGKAKINL